MIITLLGTGTSSGVPMIGCTCAVCRSLDFRDKRLRTSVHVQVAGKSLVIDTGPDFRQQALRLNLGSLDAVLFTHEHKDHTAGLDEVRAFNFRSGQDIPVYGRASVLHQLEREFAYIFAPVRYPGIPRLALHPIRNEPFEVLGIRVVPIEAMHYKLPVFGFRINDFTYLTDLNSITNSELDKLRGTRILILDALRQEPHLSHFSLPEALALVEQIRPEQTYLTHISHQMGLHRAVNLTLPPHVKLGYDGLTVDLP